jgi:hypothetical protein
MPLNIDHRRSVTGLAAAELRLEKASGGEKSSAAKEGPRAQEAETLPHLLANHRLACRKSRAGGCAMIRKGPDFLCIGMPKCGTSTLDYLLKTHTDIYLPPVKEIHLHSLKRFEYDGSLTQFLFSPHWMARQERRAIGRELSSVLRRTSPASNLLWIARFFSATRDKRWYCRLFPGDRFSGAVTPSYHALADGEIHALSLDFPSAKIIIMLRNPLHQLWSHARMSWGRADSPMPADFLEQQLSYQIGLCSNYYDFVLSWQRHFPRATGVFYLEDLQRDQNLFLNGVVTFLAAGTESKPRISGNLTQASKVNAGVNHSIPTGFKKPLQEAARSRLARFDEIDKQMHDMWLADMSA